MARLAVFEAVHGGHGAALAPGQLGIVAIIGAEREQALEVIRYAQGICQSHPRIKRLLTPGGDKVESITFRSGITIKVLSASCTSVRSGTIVCAILDEACFLPKDGAADCDVELIEALRPGLAPIIGAPRRRLIAISSAGTRSGWVYNTVNTRPPDVLVMVGTTAEYNPNIDPAYLAKRKAANPTTFAREHESVFSDCITDAWMGAANLERSIDAGRTAPMPYELGLNYRIAVDFAFQRDSTAIVVACSRWVYTDELRTERRRLTHVVYTERLTPKPGQPLSVPATLARVRKVCEAYGTATVAIDQFSSHVLIEDLKGVGVKAVKTPWVDRGDDSKLQRFLRVREAMQTGDLRLPDDATLQSELANIRSTALPSGGERLEASKGHDDMAHACVMAASIALASTPTWPANYLRWYEKENQKAAWDRVVMALHGCG
jgi:phage terminase large subunit-like protein